ncbi:MAG: CaiB/BaiF CoA-transferase family protein [Pseudomonadota bacterium]
MTNKPLDGLRILEFAGIGPTPFVGMILADFGADVVRIDRPGVLPQGVGHVTGRGRRSVALDLKSEDGRSTALKLIREADALFEGFRPGVMERMGLGPEDARTLNPKLVYGRMTGWGQSGPLAQTAGHDINYIAIAGALGTMGRPGTPPAPPLNLVGDYAGGAMFLVSGMLAALLSAQQTGRGQVIDAAMTDGTALLLSLTHDLKSFGLWRDERGTNLLDGSSPFYDTYACADDRYMAVGAIEPQFYAQLLHGLGVADDPLFANQLNTSAWPDMKTKIAELFRTKTQAQWTDIFDGTDACVSPVLSVEEAMVHPHNTARDTYIDAAGKQQPAGAPRFDGASPTATAAAPMPGQHTDEVLAEWLSGE